MRIFALSCLLCIDFHSVLNSEKTNLVSRSVINLRKLTANQIRAKIDGSALVSGVTRNPYTVVGRTTLSNVSSLLPRSTYFLDARRVRTLPRYKIKTKTKYEPLRERDLRVKTKAYELMQQFLFAAQERIWPMENIIIKYQNQWPYRAAFVFGQLQLLVHEAASIVGQESKRRPKTEFGPNEKPMPITQRSQIYWAIVRRHIDGSYLVDYLLDKVPMDEGALRLRNEVLRKEKEDIKRNERMLRKKT